jgi:hypothetical protein
MLPKRMAEGLPASGIGRVSLGRTRQDKKDLRVDQILARIDANP